MSPIELLAEDERLLFASKPAGLPVFPPHADPGGDCVLARLRVARPELGQQAWPAGFEGGIAHRLDNATSGLLIVARTPGALAELRALFSAGALRKRYRFVTARQVPWDRNVAAAAIAHDARRRDRMIVQRGASTPHRGRWYEAETAFRRVGRSGDLWDWEAAIRSGVTHQIRVHAASVGLSLLGDRPYGGGAPLTPERWPGLPEGAGFLLHHVGVEGPGLPAVRAALPPWWPRG